LSIDPVKYQEAYNSFGVQTKCTQADKLAEAYDLNGVPTLAIGGRFLTSPSQAGAGTRLPEQELGQRAVQIADFLIQRVRAKA
jgi:thiol:disulfide interchange protein DsbA